MLRLFTGKIRLFLLTLPLMIAITGALAQEACPAIVEQALAELGQNCDALDRNSACYGYNRVGATFTEPQADDFFSEASDRTGLTLIDTIQTAPLDEATQTWGVAVMKVQANVPNSLPGQAVTFVLMGEAELQNAVAPEDAFTPADPINVEALGSVNIRSGPSTRSNVLSSVSSGTILPADGRSADGAWLRVTFNGAAGWMSAEFLRAESDIGVLPVLSSDLRTPMQAFYLTTGISGSNCNDAPDALVVQGPQNLKVNLTVNGADVQIGSTVVFRSGQTSFGDLSSNEAIINAFGGLIQQQVLDPETQCFITQVMVIDGGAEINEGIIKLPTGFTAQSVQCDPPGGGAGAEGGFSTPWGEARPLTAEELLDLQTLNNLPPNILNYPISVPTLADIQAILQNIGGGNTGQGGSSAAGPVLSGPAAGQADCSGFRPTSPLGTMPGYEVPFYWDPAPGATSYTVRVYDGGGALVGEFSVNAPATSVNATPRGTGTLTWEVSAYVNGELACATSRATTIRDVTYGDPTRVPAAEPGRVNICVDPQYFCPAGCTDTGLDCGMYSPICNCPA